jgi:hypothetical protein
MIINKDFREFIRCLKDHNVEYLIVGGYAVALHGHPRYTKDLDVWINISANNAGKIVAAIRDFGFSSLQLQIEDFIQPDTIIQLGYPPIRIDLINLKKNKKASGRYQDLADIENLGGL